MPINAAVMTAPKEPTEIWQLDDPDIEPGGMLVETVASEVCGTDVHLLHGRLAGVPYPIVPGHVSVAKVLEMRDVDKDALGTPLGAGDLVTFYDVHDICGKCFYCTVTKQSNRCPSRRVYGITDSANDGPFGGWAERIYLKPDVRVVKIPEHLSADTIIGGGCGMFTGFGAVERSTTTLGDTVVVQGAGAVGLSAAAFASLKGATTVIVIGAPAQRLELAKVLGADAVLSIESDSPQHRVESVHDLTGGRGADVVIEACGNPEAVPEGLSLVRDGGNYVIVGHYTDAGPIEINPHIDINRAHVEIRGQWGTEFSHVVRALRVLAKHHDKLPFERIIGARYSLDQADQALKDLEGLKVTKAIIEPNRA